MNIWSIPESEQTIAELVGIGESMEWLKKEASWHIQYIKRLDYTLYTL